MSGDNESMAQIETDSGNPETKACQPNLAYNQEKIKEVLTFKIDSIKSETRAKKKIIISEFLAEYSETMEMHITAALSFKEKQFHEHAIRIFHRKSSKPEIISFHASENYELVKYEILIGRFLFQIKMINIFGTKDTYHGCFDLGAGTFGQIFYWRHFKEQGVAKVLRFSSDKGSKWSVIFDTIIQTCYSKLFSALKIGPAFCSTFGFDLVCYDDCIEFYLQLCEVHRITIERSNYDQLYRGLKIMHSLNIVHCDIKPENVIYSPTYQKFVFLDFGVSTIIEQQVGQKSLTAFRGTIRYASPEMKELIVSRRVSNSGYVDLYNNDVYSLNLTVKSFGDRFVSNKSLDYFEEDLLHNEVYDLIKLKYFLVEGQVESASQYLHRIQKQYDFLDRNASSLSAYFLQILPNSSLHQFYDLHLRKLSKVNPKIKAKVEQIYSINGVNSLLLPSNQAKTSRFEKKFQNSDQSSQIKLTFVSVRQAKYLLRQSLESQLQQNEQDRKDILFRICFLFFMVLKSARAKPGDCLEDVCQLIDKKINTKIKLTVESDERFNWRRQRDEKSNMIFNSLQALYGKISEEIDFSDQETLNLLLDLHEIYLILHEREKAAQLSQVLLKFHCGKQKKCYLYYLSITSHDQVWSQNFEQCTKMLQQMKILLSSNQQKLCKQGQFCCQTYLSICEGFIEAKVDRHLEAQQKLLKAIDMLEKMQQLNNHVTNQLILVLIRYSSLLVFELGSPHEAEAYAFRALKLIQQKHFKRTISQNNKYSIYTLLFRIYLKLSNIEKAQRYYDIIKSCNYNRPDFYLLVHECKFLILTHNLIEALQILDRIRKFKFYIPEKTTQILGLINAYLRKPDKNYSQGFEKMLLACFGVMVRPEIRQHFTNSWGRTMSTMVDSLMKFNLHHSNISTAFEAFQKGLKQRPNPHDQVFYHYMKGKYLLGKNSFEQALQHFEQGEKLKISSFNISFKCLVNSTICLFHSKSLQNREKSAAKFAEIFNKVEQDCTQDKEIYFSVPKMTICLLQTLIRENNYAKLIQIMLSMAHQVKKDSPSHFKNYLAIINELIGLYSEEKISEIAANTFTIVMSKQFFKQRSQGDIALFLHFLFLKANVSKEQMERHCKIICLFLYRASDLTVKTIRQELYYHLYLAQSPKKQAKTSANQRKRKFYWKKYIESQNSQTRRFQKSKIIRNYSIKVPLDRSSKLGEKLEMRAWSYAKRKQLLSETNKK